MISPGWQWFCPCSLFYYHSFYSLFHEGPWWPSLFSWCSGCAHFIWPFSFSTQYIMDLLKKFHFHTLKYVGTPCVSMTTLSLTDGELLSDSSDYRCMVSALQYLTMTKPDIAYAIHVVSQFLHALRTSHLHAVKDIFRYLQGSADCGLFFNTNCRLDLMVAFCDSNCAGYPDRSRSTTRFAVLLGANLISWRSKKATHWFSLLYWSWISCYYWSWISCYCLHCCRNSMVTSTFLGLGHSSTSLHPILLRQYFCHLSWCESSPSQPQ